MSDIETIFLDFDGVITESVDVKGEVFGSLFKEYPQHIDEIVAYHHANGGVSRFEKIKYIHKNILKKPLTEKEFKKLCGDFSRLVFRRVLECEYVPGAVEFLEKYHETIPLYIISGTPHDEINEIVKERKIGRYFRAVFGSPTPKGVWVIRLLKDKNLNPEKTLFVGDAMSDYNAAKDNRVPFAARIKDLEDNVFNAVEIQTSIADMFGLHELIAKVKV